MNVYLKDSREKVPPCFNEMLKKKKKKKRTPGLLSLMGQDIFFNMSLPSCCILQINTVLTKLAF